MGTKINDFIYYHKHKLHAEKHSKHAELHAKLFSFCTEVKTFKNYFNLLLQKQINLPPRSLMLLARECKKSISVWVPHPQKNDQLTLNCNTEYSQEHSCLMYDSKNRIYLDISLDEESVFQVPHQHFISANAAKLFSEADLIKEFMTAQAECADALSQYYLGMLYKFGEVFVKQFSMKLTSPLSIDEAKYWFHRCLENKSVDKFAKYYIDVLYRYNAMLLKESENNVKDMAAITRIELINQLTIAANVSFQFPLGYMPAQHALLYYYKQMLDLSMDKSVENLTHLHRCYQQLKNQELETKLQTFYQDEVVPLLNQCDALLQDFVPPAPTPELILELPDDFKFDPNLMLGRRFSHQ
jgi:hypothetical protein